MPTHCKRTPSPSRAWKLGQQRLVIQNWAKQLFPDVPAIEQLGEIPQPKVVDPI